MRPTLICFAGDVWDGNPHSRHHLMRRFSESYDVLFVEGVPMRTLAPGDSHDWRRAARKLARGSALREVHPGLHVLRPVPVPPAGRLGRRAQLVALRHQVERACKRIGVTGPRLLWFSLPVAAPLRGSLGERASIFYYQDRYDAFTHVDSRRLRTQVAALARGCDVTLATATALADDLRALGADPVTIPHGVDLERFSGEFSEPEDLAELERPLVGCIGLIDDHLSFEALLATADGLDEGTLVMVGDTNVELDRLRHPRIEFLGRRPYDSMPAYLAAFDVCLVPFGRNRLTQGVNPIKLREYLAAGRPVVSTRLPEVEPYGDVVALADGPDDFAEAVARQLSGPHDTPADRDARRRRVANESWDRVAASIEGHLAGLLTRS